MNKRFGGSVQENQKSHLEIEREKIKHKYDIAPRGWLTNNKLSDRLGVSRQKIKIVAKKFIVVHPEWARGYVSKRGQADIHYSPELVDLIKRDLLKHEKAPEGWATRGELAKKWHRADRTIEKWTKPFKKSHPQWFKVFVGKNIPRSNMHYSPELIDKISKNLSDYEVSIGWLTIGRLAKELGKAHITVQKISKRYRSTHTEWFKQSFGFTYFSPELVEIIKKEATRYSSSPEGWMTSGELEKLLNRDRDTIRKFADKFKNEHPEWFQRFLQRKINRPEICYSPELVERIKENLRHEKKKAENIAQNLKALCKNISEHNSVESQEFKNIISMFGSSMAIDILYAHHPDFKSLPVEKTKKIIAEYLGNFLLTRFPFNVEVISNGLAYLDRPEFAEGLYEVVKDDALNHYLRTRKINTGLTDQEIFSDYFEDIKAKTLAYNDKELSGIITRVENYYLSLNELEKPGQLVDTISPNRRFPDIYQLININEVKAKRRLLIADEMGVGKSASAIMAKEYLDSKLALVVVPSNVIETWENYLSDITSEEGKQTGYFRKGQAPCLLRVENVKDLEKVNQSTYDYILISQERLSETYVNTLQKTGYDLLIVDEVHKLKNIKKGVRSDNFLKLAESIGENGYLIMLSGTPVPNKIQDVALLLKSLYPEKFGSINNKQLISSIIHGNISEIRNLLVSRMQRKNLRDHVEMPQITEIMREIELSKEEKRIYEVLLDEDELTAIQKIEALRQFLLNPQNLDMSPEILGTKIEQLNQYLSEIFKEKDKIVVFINDYIDGILYPSGRSAIDQLRLEEGIKIRTIHGQTSKEERQLIQEEFNTTKDKILLAVSGNTADVGVDFSGGEHIYFYNEPWTKPGMRQQISRVYRPGLKTDLDVEVLITKGTIEEGIHSYAEVKNNAIEKLLNGIPITELEKEILVRDEKSSQTDLEVNPELASYYFSVFDKLKNIYAFVKEIGEEDFYKFLQEYGDEYARCYLELGSRNYQANANRVAATVIKAILTKYESRPKILDLASGPEMLRKYIHETLREKIVSMDINKQHFADHKGPVIVGGLSKIPIKDKTVNIVNLSLAFHYTRFVPSKNEFERACVLAESNRILKNGGKLVINMIYSMDFKNYEKFKQVISQFGFRVIESYSGQVSSGSEYDSRIVTLEKISDAPADVEDILSGLEKLELDGLKLVKRERRLVNQRRIIKSFELNDGHFNIEFNEKDKVILAREEQIVKDGEVLKEKYGNIKDISTEELEKYGFGRIRIGKKQLKYILFKEIGGAGIITIK